MPDSTQLPNVTPNARLQLLARLLKPSRALHIVDVGSNPMQRGDPHYRQLLDAGLARLTGFDPQEGTLDSLVARGNMNEIYLPHAIGDGETHTLHVFRGTGLASLLPIRRETIGYVRGLKRAARPLGKKRMQTKRLDEIKEISGVDFLKIDIQGAELAAFSGGSRALHESIAVQTEMSFFPLYHGQPGFGEIDVFLREAGFVPHSFIHLVRRRVLSRWHRSVVADPPSQLLDGDILYLRDLSRPEFLSDWQLTATALICEGVFSYSDIALRCLDALEQRGAVSLAGIERYVRSLELA